MAIQPTPPTPQRLLGIEALRGLAAVAVVLSHAARHVDSAASAPALLLAFQPGHAGVDLFFVLSGFIILFVHRGDIGRPDRLAHYLARRFTRVMPLYWVALILTVALGIAAGHGFPTLRQLLLSVTLLPAWSGLVLDIAWTLEFELVFYAVFAVLIIRRHAGVALLMGWLIWILAASAGHGDKVFPTPLRGVYCLEFFMGMAAAQALHLFAARIKAPLLLAGLGLALYALAWAAESASVIEGPWLLPRLAFGLPAAMMVLGVATAERQGRLAVPGWLARIGAASYSIYLFQFLCIGTLWQVLMVTGLDRSLSSGLLFLALVAAAVIGGVIVSTWIERPLLRALRGGFSRPTPTVPSHP